MNRPIENDTPCGLDIIRDADPDIAQAIEQEYARQKYTLEMIASENIVSPAVMAVQASVLTNKYAEGYPEKRYYGGCEFVDIAEAKAIERACSLFGAEYANVQPHSGSQANMAAYFALLEPGDTILGMDLAHGGHLTHGAKVSFSGRIFKSARYGVSAETGTIDYDEVARIAEECRPKLIIAGASAYPRLIDFEAFSAIARSVNALLLVDMAHIAGLVAAGFHPSPIPHAQVVTTTTHKTLRGPRGGMILAKKEYGKKIDKEIFPGIQGGPLMHVIAAKAVALKLASEKDFKQYQARIIKNAKCLAKTLIERGINLVSGGTDNHMMLADLRNLKITGKQAEHALGEAGITVNKNAIPFDPLGPAITSGIRIGTPALTTRGMGEAEMAEIGNLIADVLEDADNTKKIAAIRQKTKEICARFPLYKCR